MFNHQIKDPVSVTENVTCTIRDAKTGKIKRTYKIKNTVQLAGRAVEARRLANNTTYTGIINYGILCTGGTPAEYFRKVVASATYDDATAKAYVSWFFTAAEVVGTFTQWRNCIDGAAGAGTGQEWTRVNVSWVKSALESLTVDCIYTFNAV
ncbi:MAG: hypothetical protein WC445_01285 [Patescibacteria group bacterium]